MIGWEYDNMNDMNKKYYKYVFGWIANTIVQLSDTSQEILKN